MTTPSVSVCIPARNEAANVGALVSAVVDHPQASEVLVLDHASHDATARIAQETGAEVIDADSVLSQYGPALGKGDVLWRSVEVACGDIVVWLDADLRSFTPDYLTSLVQPLASNPNITLVKPDYARTLHGQPSGGGRITERTAKPTLRSLHPHLSHIRQPLAGEYAIRREVARNVPFEIDYGVEIGLLIDIADAYGVDSIAQVQLPPRVHRNRTEPELTEPARQVERTARSRAGLARPKSRPPLSTVQREAVCE